MNLQGHAPDLQTVLLSETGSDKWKYVKINEMNNNNGTSVIK